MTVVLLSLAYLLGATLTMAVMAWLYDIDSEDGDMIIVGFLVLFFWYAVIFGVLLQQVAARVGRARARMIEAREAAARELRAAEYEVERLLRSRPRPFDV